MSNTDEQWTGNWNYPTHVRFGVGRIAELPAACAGVGMNRPLLVTDKGISALPMIAEAVAKNIESGLPTAVFDDVKSNPTGSNVASGIDAYRKNACDGVIAWGGGSALDVGKAIALMVGQNRPIWDFEDIGDYWTRVRVEGMAPVVAVPTTSGTGSEVGRSSVIAHEQENNRKVIVFHPNMMPSLALCDPALTLGLPPGITAATGMDALSHNLEAFCARGFHPLADGIALEGIRLIHTYLERAFRTPDDLEARSNVMAASLMGATAFQKGLGAMHALSHPLGATLDAHHGLSNAIVMPYVLRWNQQTSAERLERLERYLGLTASGGDALIDWVLALRESLAIPNTLTALGMQREHIEVLAPMAVVDPAAAGNPRSLDLAGATDLFRNALDGNQD